ncbi:Ribosomal RNA large subunit methyltransferase E [Smittium culicis]|uniref:rRNA methyltransferase 2, mitochondrial n=1 Tax=Smittium culicis TaxID=133412 RepID=A0A1R1X8M2_9FUNG|nr:Ribosomal RNA large subunit methyltransferase E [Smittium culicis]
MRPVKGVSFIQGDFTLESTKTQISSLIGEKRKVGLVLSDMAPNISGNRVVDDARSMDLCLSVLDFSKNHLDQDGNLVMKYFMGESAPVLKKNLQLHFSKVISEKPKSSRKESAEQYYVCLGYKKV